jgi:microcystin-dependent protein
MSSPFLGEIRIFCGNFNPRGWALCDGQLLSISQNTALFSILGTTYGGNGTSNFALPDFRDRVPMSFGNGPGLTPRVLGETGGEATVTLSSNQVGSHNHTFGCAAGSKGESATVTNQSNSDLVLGVNAYATAADATVMLPNMLQPTPASQPHENRQPYQGVTFIIATQGVFPPRN